MVDIDTELRLAHDTVDSPVSAEEFKRAFRNHPAGVALITADAGSGPVALTATSVFSISAEPPVFAFSLSALSSATPTIRSSSSVVLHLLGKDRKDLAVLGSTSGINRFGDATMWRRLPTGEPLFLGVPHWIRAEISDLVQIGASTMVVAAAVEVSPEALDHDPLVYHNRTWHALGPHSQL